MDETPQQLEKRIKFEEQFKMGGRSVYRPEKHKKGDTVSFVTGLTERSREYIVGENGNLIRKTSKPKGKAAVKAAKRARHGK